MFRAIVPKSPIIDQTRLARAVLDAIDDTTEVMLNDFEKTTKTWEHDVDFYQVRASQQGDMGQGAAGTDDTIYGYVTRGTKPHGEDAVNANMMFFATDSVPKTTKGTIGSKGNSNNSDFVFTKHVDHPGIEARGFEDTISTRRQRNLQTNVQAAIAREVERSS